MHHRDYYQKMGAMLKFLLEEGKPVSIWRLTYYARITSYALIRYIEDMERFRLIKRVNTNERSRGPRRYGEVGQMDVSSQRHIVITPKGARLVSLTQQMAALLPKAPWILENEY